jgi:hypothetical protein
MKLPKINKDGALVIILAIVAIFAVKGAFFKDEPSRASSESSGECYDRVAKEMAEREGNKVVNASDIERYRNELIARCN